jgi:hypothetical protein
MVFNATFNNILIIPWRSVLLLDRVTLSLDDKHDDEFIFATINDNHIDKTLYFVISNDSYANCAF